MPGTIGVCCERLARYTDFAICLKVLEEPEGTVTGFAQSSSVPENHERLLRQFGGEWLWSLDDDMTFEPDALGRLLAHGVEAVVPLSTRRSPPILPVAYRQAKDGAYEPVDLTGASEDGLMRIDACGWGGLLLRRSAVEKLGDPPYVPMESFTEHEDMRKGSDILFCEKLRECGVKLWLDPGTRLGHIGLVTYSAGLREGQWGAVLDLDGTGQVFMPWEVEG